MRKAWLISCSRVSQESRKSSRVQSWLGSRLSSIWIRGGPEAILFIMLVVSPTQAEFARVSSVTRTVIYWRKEPRKKLSSNTSTKKLKGSGYITVLTPIWNRQACQRASASIWISSSPSLVSSNFGPEYWHTQPPTPHIRTLSGYQQILFHLCEHRSGHLNRRLDDIVGASASAKDSYDDGRR